MSLTVSFPFILPFSELIPFIFLNNLLASDESLPSMVSFPVVILLELISPLR